ncbi:MAG: hypothetical protein Ct9H300mP20_01470 [Gammaproteobacteria bacterium]|nr:MAG: hypothetical protein Ct9H300mP20_01470 [Gammaproteobacteria bacterium]
MGGSSIFRVRSLDPNIAVILENITKNGDTKVMIQKYIPEIVEGDKRILLIEECLWKLPLPGFQPKGIERESSCWCLRGSKIF